MYKGGKNGKCRVAFPESIPIPNNQLLFLAVGGCFITI